MEALENLQTYSMKADSVHAPIDFKFGIAERYKVEKEDNCFYFFNPFTVPIFKKVVNNIIRSVDKHNRPVDMILYYPFPDYVDFLRTTPFTIIKDIEVPDATDVRERFVIYRLDDND